MATWDQLQAWKARLQEARYSGLREVRDANGESVAYKSDTEMARALDSIEYALARRAGTSPISIAYPQTSKGL